MRQKEVLMFLNIAHFFDHYFLLIFPTAAIAIAVEWDMSYGAVLVMGTPLYVTFAVATLPAGWLGDRFDRTFLIACFFLGGGAASLLVSFSSGPVSLMAGLALLGLFAALYHPIGLALVPDIAQRTGRALAVNGVFGNMGLAAAVAVTGVLAEHSGWQSGFLAPGIAGLIAGTILLLRRWRAGNPCGGEITRRQRDHHPAHPDQRFRCGLRGGAVWRLCVQCGDRVDAEIFRRTAAHAGRRPVVDRCVRGNYFRRCRIRAIADRRTVGPLWRAADHDRPRARANCPVGLPGAGPWLGRGAFGACAGHAYLCRNSHYQLVARTLHTIWPSFAGGIGRICFGARRRLGRRTDHCRHARRRVGLRYSILGARCLRHNGFCRRMVLTEIAQQLIYRGECIPLLTHDVLPAMEYSAPSPAKNSAGGSY